MSNEQLIFVYNSGSGLLSTFADFAHKILSPSTYQCQLCALTYGNLSMKRNWKLYLETLPFKVSFLYKDDFLKMYNITASFPAIFISNIDVIRVLVTKNEIDACESLEELMDLISGKLSRYDQHHHTNI